MLRFFKCSSHNPLVFLKLSLGPANLLKLLIQFNTTGIVYEVYATVINLIFHAQHCVHVMGNTDITESLSDLNSMTLLGF